MSLRGNLNSVDLANIFQMLSINQKEGTLNIFDGDSKKSIYFSRDGVSMLSRGKQKKDTLGRILLRYNRLSEPQLERALEKQERSGRLLGVILEEGDFVPRDVIEDALRIQIEEEIYNLFIWKDASFEFIEGAPPREFDEVDGTITRLTFNVNSLIMEAARRIDEWEHIQQVVPSMNEVYQYTGKNMELTDDIFREPYCEKVLAAINGRSAVEEIIDRSCVNKFEVCKILALLIDQRAVEPIGARDLSDAAEAALERGDVAEAIKFLQRVVELGDDRPETHLNLGKAFESQEEVAKACVHYRNYAEEMLSRGQPQAAFETYRRICELLPTDLPAIERMVEVYVEHADEIEGQARFVMEKGKTLARIYVEIDKKSRAVQTLHRVITLDPNDFSLRHLLVNIYLANNMSSEAIAEYEAMAETYSRKRDWEQVVKILRKILVIDRTREDVAARLQQLLNRKAKKKRNLRRLVVLVIVILGLSVLGYGYVTYELDARRQTAIAEQEATRMLESLNRRIQPIRDTLEDLSRQIAKGTADLDELARAHDQASKLRDQYEKGVREAVAKLESVANRYKFARAKEEAVARQEELREMLTGFDRAISHARRQIQERALRLVDQAEDALREGKAREALGLYEQAWAVAIDRTHMENMDVDRKIESARELVGELDALYGKLDRQLVDEKYSAAYTTGLEILNLYFTSEVLNEVRLPLRVESSPPGARVLLNGEDSGVRTPGWITYHPGQATEVTFQLDGFTTAVETIPPARAGIPDDEMQEISERQLIRKDLKKEMGWHGSLEGAVEARPCLDGETLLVATRSSQIWIVDLAGKTRALFVDVGDISLSGIHADPVLLGGSLYFATLEGRIRRVDRKSRQTLWERTGSGMVYAPLSAADGFLVVGDVKGGVTAYDIESGEPVWQHRHADEIRCRPVISDGKVHVATTGGHLYVYDLASGRLVWDAPVGSEGRPVYSDPLVVGERVYVASTDGRLYALEPGRDEPVWKVETGAEIRANPLIIQDAIVLATISGRVHAIREGEVVATMEVGEGTRSAPATDGDRLFFAGDSGRLVSAEFDGKSFRTNWRHDIRGPEGEVPEIRTSPVLVGDRIVILAESGDFYVVRD